MTTDTHIKNASATLRWFLDNSDDIPEALMLAVLTQRGDSGMDENEMKRIYEYAEAEIRMISTIHLILQGFITMSWGAEEDEPKFRLTEKGKSAGAQLAKNS